MVAGDPVQLRVEENQAEPAYLGAGGVGEYGHELGPKEGAQRVER